MKNLFRTELAKVEDFNKVLIDGNAEWDFAKFFTLNAHQATYIDKAVDKEIPFGVYVKYAGFKRYFYVIIPNGDSTCQLYKVCPGKNDSQTENIILGLFNYLEKKN